MSSSAILKRSWIALGRPGEKVSFDEVAARWGSEGRPYHNAFDYARGKDDRDIVLAHASSDQVCILSRDHQFLKALPFWEAFSASEDTERAVACVCVGTGLSQDELLVAASMDHRIAVWVASASTSRKWRVHSTVMVSEGTVTSLDIHAGRLLVGTISSLSLWDLETDHIGIWRRAWTQPCPAPITLARFSPDASSIAAATERSQNVVIWTVPRKSSSALVLNQQLFHPYRVHHFVWRQPPERSSQDGVLVTYTDDGVARIWAAVIDEPMKLRLWTTLDPPRDGFPADDNDMKSGKSHPRTFYMDAAAVSSALRANIAALNRELHMIELGVGSGGDAKSHGDAHAAELETDTKRTRLRRLEQILSEAPDMFLSFSGDGYMVLTAVANIDRRPPTLLQTFTVLRVPYALSVAANQIRDVMLVPMYVGNDASSEDPFATLQIRTTSGTPLSFGLNPSLFFDGRGRGLSSFGVPLNASSSPPAGTTDRHAAHGGRLSKIIRSCDGTTIVSVSAQDAICWETVVAEARVNNIPQRMKALGYLAKEELGLTALSDDNQLLATLTSNKLGVSAVGASASKGTWIETPPFDAAAMQLVRSDATDLVFVCTKRATIHSWAISLSSNKAERLDDYQLPCTFDDDREDYPLINSITGCGDKSEASANFVTVSSTGVLERWTSSLKTNSKGQLIVAWDQSARIDTRVSNVTKACCSTSGLNALVSIQPDGRQLLSIFDSTVSTFTSGLEHQREYETGAEITALDWSPSTLVTSTLAVAFSHQVEVLSPKRHGISPDSAETCLARWEPCGRVFLGDATPSRIRDVVWLAHERLAIGSASIIYVHGPFVEETQVDQTIKGKKVRHLAELIAERTGPLPQYHPTFLHECLLWNNLHVARTILGNLRKAVNSVSPNLFEETWNFEDAPFSQFASFGLSGMPKRMSARIHGHQANGASIFDETSDTDSSDEELSEKGISLLIQALDNLNLPHLHAEDRKSLVTIIKTTIEAEEQKRSLDENGLRYLISLRLHLNRSDANDAGPGSNFEALGYRDIVWALHSEQQELLVSAIERAFQNKVTASVAGSTGIFMWLKSHQTIRTLAEQVARAQFMVGEDRDPVKCSLFYFALGKIKVVQGLWKQAVWHPEQKKMLQFLSHDFTEERWRTAAQKNAFALLSQRRYEFAASFFMLGDSLKDAVNVCVRNLNDVELAIALARIREGGDDGPVFKDLLQRQVLPQAFELGQRWLASWAFWMLKRRDLAVRVIVTPLAEMLADLDVATIVPSDIKCGDGHYDDASLAILFKQLKDKSLQTMRGSAAIPEKKEFDFVLHMNKVLCRMGCHTLGLNLLRTWVFEPPVVASSTTGYHAVTEEDLQSLGRVQEDVASRDMDLFGALAGRASTSPTRLRRRDSQTSMSPPSSPRVSRRRSSLLRRRSSIVNDLDIGSLGLHEQGQSSSGTGTLTSPAHAAEPSFFPKGTVIREEPQAIADEDEKTELPQEGAPKTKGISVFKSAAASNANQGAQEFDFGSFGF